MVVVREQPAGRLFHVYPSGVVLRLMLELLEE